MGVAYQKFKNPINDFFVELLMEEPNKDLSNKKTKADIKTYLSNFALNYIQSSEIKYIDFDIKRKDIKYTVIPNNFATALFFVGIMASDFQEINLLNRFETNQICYNFDKKKRKLIIKKTIN